MKSYSNVKDHPLDCAKSVHMAELLLKYNDEILGLHPKDADSVACGKFALMRAIEESNFDQNLVDVLLKNEVQISKSMLDSIYKSCKTRGTHISKVCSELIPDISTCKVLSETLPHAVYSGDFQFATWMLAKGARFPNVDWTLRWVRLLP